MADGQSTIADPERAAVKQKGVSLPPSRPCRNSRLIHKQTDYTDAVFYLQSGATLKNVIIGKNQAEGVHCNGPCTLEFVWWEDVCEDALTIKNDVAGQESWIIGGGAYKASDKVVQHNGCGTVNIINFYVNDYGKLYRSCGNVSSVLSCDEEDANFRRK